MKQGLQTLIGDVMEQHQSLLAPESRFTCLFFPW